MVAGFARRFTHRRVIALSALILVAILGLLLARRLATNLGLLALNRAIAVDGPFIESPPGDPAWGEADRWLGLARAIDAANASVQRGWAFAQIRRGDADAATTLLLQSAGVSVSELVQRGAMARSREANREAVQWYALALQLSPDLSDAWYYQGQAFGNLSEWNSARTAYARAMQADNFQDVGRSSPLYRLGEIYQFRVTPKRLDLALKLYTDAIALDDFTLISEAGDAHYKLGEIYTWQEVDPGQIIAEYRRALSLSPDHYWARLKLGEMLYLAHGDASQAEAEIERALELWPDDSSRKWPYRSLGDIYRGTGRRNSAMTMYQMALDRDPADDSLRALYQQLLSTPNGATP